jgi:hypothetical protein
MVIALTQLRSHARNANATEIDFPVRGRFNDGLTPPTSDIYVNSCSVIFYFSSFLLALFRQVFLLNCSSVQALILYIHIYIYIYHNILNHVFIYDVSYNSYNLHHWPRIFAQPIHTRPRPPTYVCYVYPNVRKHSQSLANTFTNIWNHNVAHNSTNIDTSKLQKP